jgi:hypothetical protein
MMLAFLMMQIVFSWFLDVLSTVSIYVCTIVTSDDVMIVSKKNHTENKCVAIYSVKIYFTPHPIFFG